MISVTESIVGKRKEIKRGLCLEWREKGRCVGKAQERSSFYVVYILKYFYRKSNEQNFRL